MDSLPENIKLVDLLPEEVLGCIFSYLIVPDRLNAALVCKKWLDAMNCRSLLKDIKVLINDNNTLPLYKKSSRNFLNFKFSMVIIDKNYYELFERISSTVEYLSFEHCEIWKREPVKFDLTFDNLRVLESLECNLWLLFPNVPNLSELWLSGNSTISDEGVSILQKTMKNLKTLKLDLYIAFDRLAYKRFYGPSVSYEANPSSIILSFPSIMSFISERASTLKELRLNNALTTKALVEISNIKNLSLHKIDISCYECHKSVVDLVKNQPSLRVLNLYGTSDIADGTISDICSFLPDIEELYLDNCQVSSHSLNKILRLKKLQKLRLTGSDCKSDRILEFLKDVECISLKSLDIRSTQFKCIDFLINLCPNLVCLDLSGCHIEDFILHLISTVLTKLEYLNLKNTLISDYALTGVRPAGENEVEAGDKNDNISPVSLSNLKHLRSLQLNGCKKITMSGLREAIHFKNLEYINLCGCDVNISTVEVLIHQNPSLRKIYCDEDLKTDSLKSNVKVVNVKSKRFRNQWATVLNEKCPLTDSYDDDMYSL